MWERGGERERERGGVGGYKAYTHSHSIVQSSNRQELPFAWKNHKGYELNINTNLRERLKSNTSYAMDLIECCHVIIFGHIAATY